MDSSLRISDADRERVAAQLREHFAEGRLSSEELDERLSAVFNAKTYADLRPITADLPGPALAPPQTWAPAPWAVRRGGIVRRGPGIVPLALLALAAVLLLPGAGWLFFAVLNMILAFWLVTFLGLAVAGVLFHRRLRRHSRPGAYWGYYQWHGPARW